MGPAPGVEANDRARIRARARAKLFGERAPASASQLGTEDTECGTTGAPAPPPPKDPERIGRFRILDRLGAGGMGVVYSAYDPELDRKVALKLLLPDLAEDASRGSTGTSRLQREAQAMARLNHPNVVTVHEVGKYEEQVFVAMEFVDGTTLRQWARESRHWQEVVRVYCDAAEGLEAAHAAGIVHRDFKPDNVMLGEDGRVRVMDFGLSRSDRSAPTLDDVGPTDDQPATLTQTGAIMGTPAYMAPEQHNASPTTAASDQFAFCVSLWEALTGVRPFAGRTYGELAANVVSGRIQAPPGSATAPRRIFDALRTGLATNPEHRFSSMSALVATLRVSPFRTLRRVGLGFAAVSLAASAVYVGTRPEALEVGACDDAGAPLRDFWEGKRASVEAALLRPDAPYAAATWSSVDRMLGAYVDDWARASEAHCTAQLVESASAATLERQAQCLASRRSAVEELAAVLSTSEDGIAQEAVQAVVTLGPVESCADPRRLEAFSVARAPEAIEAINQARAQLARARAHGGLAHYDRAIELADGVIATARRYDDPSTEAAGLLVRGQYTAEHTGDDAAAEKSLRDAIRLAEIGDDHTTRALALIRLIYIVGGDAKRHAEARSLGADAGAVLRMLGADPLLQAGLDMNLGRADRVGRELDDALTHYTSALDIYSKIYGEDHPNTARALTSLGGLYITRREPELAVEVLERAEASFKKTLGAEHPFVPVVLGNLGTAYKAQDDFPRAIETLERALVLRKRAAGEKHRGVAKILFNLGAAQYEAQRYDDAIKSLQRGLDILIEIGSNEPARLGRYRLLIGSAHLNSRRFELARQWLEPLLEVFPVTGGPSGKFARRARYYLSIATIPVDLRRARTLAQVARESAAATDPEAALLDHVLWLLDTAEHGRSAPAR